MVCAWMLTIVCGRNRAPLRTTVKTVTSGDVTQPSPADAPTTFLTLS